MHFKNISIVLNEPSHPGNIGSVARAMKTMGFSNLVLVSPKEFPHHDAIAMAAGADDLMGNAKMFTDLKAALADYTLIFATSARHRYLKTEAITPRQCTEKILETSNDQKIAILFGNERVGLSNEDLACAHYQVIIPTNPDFSSLNLAAAVQILTYDLRQECLRAYPGACSQHPENLDSLPAQEMTSMLSRTPNTKPLEEKATFDSVDGLLNHWEAAMQQIGFLDPQNPKLLMARLQRLLMRAQLTRDEVNILRGFLRAVQQKASLK